MSFLSRSSIEPVGRVKMETWEIRRECHDQIFPFQHCHRTHTFPVNRVMMIISCTVFQLNIVLIDIPAKWFTDSKIKRCPVNRYHLIQCQTCFIQQCIPIGKDLQFMIHGIFTFIQIEVGMIRIGKQCICFGCSTGYDGDTVIQKSVCNCNMQCSRISFFTIL